MDRRGCSCKSKKYDIYIIIKFLKGIRKRLKGAFKIEYANALVGRQAAINRGNVGSSLTQGVRESQ